MKTVMMQGRQSEGQAKKKWRGDKVARENLEIRAGEKLMANDWQDESKK